MLKNSPAAKEPEFRFGHGCVVSYCPTASSIGARILREGGNAIDASVAAGLALAITYPQAGNLGGGGFMVVQSASKELAFLDYRETAPANVELGDFLDDDGNKTDATLYGGAPVCVPGTIAGLAAAHERWGLMGWDRILGIVIGLAEVGTWMTTRQSAYFRMYEKSLSTYPTTRETYLPSGSPLQPGTLWRQPDLANTLRELADHGPEAFYKGRIAERIVETVRAYGGRLEAEDLASYQVKWRQPRTASFCGREIVSASLPSGGGIVIEMALAVLEASGIQHMIPNSRERYFLLSRALRVGFEVRRRLTGDPDFASAAEFEEGVRLAKECRARAGDLDGLERYLDLSSVGRRRGSEDLSKNTTHFCAMDKFGNSVSNTYSLNTLFGSRLVPAGCGFLLNNSIDDFSLGTGPNYYGLIEDGRNQPMPGRRPTGSMAPTLALSDGGEVEVIVGASGGPYIPSVIVQLLIGVLCDGEILPVTMRAPRIHHQSAPDRVSVEPTLRQEIQDAFMARDGDLKVLPRLGIGIGIHRPVNGFYASLDYRFSQEA